MVVAILRRSVLVIANQRTRQDSVLGQSLCLADGVVLPVRVTLEQCLEVLRVDEHVIIGIYRSCSTEESHGSTLVVEQGSLADIVSLTVKGHDIT